MRFIVMSVLSTGNYSKGEVARTPVYSRKFSSGGWWGNDGRKDEPLIAVLKTRLLKGCSLSLPENARIFQPVVRDVSAVVFFSEQREAVY